MSPTLITTACFLLMCFAAAVDSALVTGSDFGDQHKVQRLGCYSDNPVANDMQARQSDAGKLNSPRHCTEYCRNRAFKYAGLQAATWCHCSNIFGRYGSKNDSDCNAKCPADANATCGSVLRNEVYTTGIYSIGSIAAKEADLQQVHRLVLLRTKTDGRVQRLGCYQDNNATGQRDLPFVYFAQYSASPELCVAQCRSMGYRFAGVQSIDWCACGNSFGRHGRLNDSECQLWCLGDPSATCGGYTKNEVYATGIYPSGSLLNSQHGTNLKETLKAMESDGRVQRLGCYREDPIRKQPDLPVQRQDNRTSPQFCVSLCRSLAYRFAGMKAGDWCSCGNTYGRYARLSDSECATPCVADAVATCGGDNRNEIYSTGIYPPGTPSLARERNPQLIQLTLSRMRIDGRVQRFGCYADRNGPGARDLPFRVSVAANATSPHRCVRLCRRMAFKFAGLQGGADCRCGNSFGRYGRLGDGECGVPCPGDGEGGVTCGGDMRNEIYSTGIYPSGAMLNQMLNRAFRRWIQYIEMPGRVQRFGCYEERELNGTQLDMPFRYPAGNVTSPQFCVGLCRALAYPFAGLQAGGSCSCGNTFGRFFRLGDDQCDATCWGDANATCGATLANEVFGTGVDPLDAHGTDQLERLGCYEERGWNEPHRVKLDGDAASGAEEPMPGPLDLPVVTDSAGDNSPQFCANLCRSRAFKYAGLRDGSICACGNSFGRYGKLADSRCGSRCPGDRRVTCGSARSNEIFATGVYAFGSESSASGHQPYDEALREALLSIHAVAGGRVQRFGCYADGEGRGQSDLPYYVTVGDRASPDFCVTLCRRKGRRFAGLRGGNTCGCGDSFGRQGKVPDAECNEKCLGDASVTCGGRLKSEIFSTGIGRLGSVNVSARK